MSLVLLFNQYGGPIHGTAAGKSAEAVGAAFGTFISGGTGGTGASTAQQLRVYGRINQVNGIGGQWVVVTTDANGYNDEVFLTALCQCLKLNLGEDPFWASSGIPAQQSVITQVFPDYYAVQTQTFFAQFFASLVITRIQGSNPPVYNVQVVTHSGSVLTAQVAT